MAKGQRYLVVVVHADRPGIQCVSAHASEDDAEPVLEMLKGLVAPTSAIYLLPIPGAAGFMSETVAPINEPVPLRSARSSGLAIAAADVLSAMQNEQTDKPAPFRRRSAGEFEAETVAMMNGEISVDGIQIRDVDDPLSEGGAVS